MEQFTQIRPILCEILGRNKKCSINVTNKEDHIIVSILSGRRWKRFNSNDTIDLISDLKQSFSLS